jgi:hypothetical protein
MLLINIEVPISIESFEKMPESVKKQKDVP